MEPTAGTGSGTVDELVIGESDVMLLKRLLLQVCKKHSESALVRDALLDSRNQPQHRLGLFQLTSSALTVALGFLDWRDLLMADSAFTNKATRPLWLVALVGVDLGDAFKRLLLCDNTDENESSVFWRSGPSDGAVAIWWQAFGWVVQRGVLLPSMIDFPSALTSAQLAMLTRAKTDRCATVGVSAGDVELAVFSQFKALKRLEIFRVGDGIDISASGLAHLSALPLLEDLSIRGGRVKLDKIDGGLKALTGLKRLNLRHNFFNVDDAYRLALAVASLTKLQELSLIVSETSNKAFSSLSSLRQLRSLRFNGDFDCETILTTDERMKLLGELKHLVLLELDGTSVMGSCLPFLACWGLEKLNLGTAVSDDGLAQSLMHFPNLRYLRLFSETYNCNISDVGLAHCQHCTQLATLAVLSGSNNLGEGLKHLPFSLRVLNFIDCTGLSDEGLFWIAKLTRLQILQLDYSFEVEEDETQPVDLITDTGLSYLAGMSSLLVLGLVGRNNLTGHGIRQLSGLERLRILNLGSCEGGISGSDLDVVVENSPCLWKIFLPHGLEYYRYFGLPYRHITTVKNSRDHVFFDPEADEFIGFDCE